MNRLISTLLLFVVAVASFAQSITLTPPRSMRSEVSTRSVGAEFDGSLLRVVSFFDSLDSSYVAFSYDLAQVNGLLNNPIRVGWAGAARGGENYWTGPTLSYTLLNHERFTVGLMAGFPGIELRDQKLGFASDWHVVPGVFFSARF